MNGPCKNNGTCYNLIGGFNCFCNAGWEGDFCETPSNSCSMNLHNENGTIKFPISDHQLLPNKKSYNCEWRIDAVVGKVIEIDIKNLTIDYSPSCANQYLKISDGIPGLAETRQIAKLCGNLDENSTKNITSAHNSVTITYFTSNDIEESYEDTNIGFELEWRTVSPKCGGLIENATHGRYNFN